MILDDDDDDDEEDDDDDDEGNSHFDDIVEESALRFPTITDPDSDDIEYLFYPEHNDVILEHLEDRGRRSLHLPMWWGLRPFLRKKKRLKINQHSNSF